jgi:hypothetical protein
VSSRAAKVAAAENVPRGAFSPVVFEAPSWVRRLKDRAARVSNEKLGKVMSNGRVEPGRESTLTVRRVSKPGKGSP